MMGLIRCHHCEGEDCFDETYGSQFCSSLTGKCFTLVDLTNEHVTHRRGCVTMDLMCFSGSHFTNEVDIYMKCCSTNLCNSENFTMFNPDGSRATQAWTLWLSGIAIFLVILAIFAIVMLKRKYFASKTPSLDLETTLQSFHKDDKNQKKNKPDLEECSMISSGSGSHDPKLVRRTFSKDIDLKKNIGGGRFGSVWKGVYHYNEVAVKIFLSRDEASFQREIEIYTNYIGKHENILTFIGSDVTSRNSCTQLWLVTWYHELGSLFDYLGHHTISLDDMFAIMNSIVSGIDYLHNACSGTKKTVEIAHRDIKSKNILMKSKNICCIADFGLAVTLQHKTGSLDIGCNYRVGTKRYMAPEVLGGTLNPTHFDSFTKADIYSMSLVLWEVIRRVQGITPMAFKYEVPFQYQVPSDPSFEDMKQVVFIQNYRPEIPPEIEQHPILNPVCMIIREAWSKAPAARLSALRIRKSLHVLGMKFKADDIQNHHPSSTNETSV